MSRFTLDALPPKYAAQAQAQMYATVNARKTMSREAEEALGKMVAHVLASNKTKRPFPVPSPAPPAKAPRKAVSGAVRAKRKQSESASQQALIKWWATACHEFRLPEEILMAFPLQGARSARNGARMKAEGMRRGTPDVLLAIPRGDCCALWIEMKSLIGYLRPEQKKMLAVLTEHGAATVVCRSTEEAIKAVTGYLLMPNTPATVPIKTKS